MVAGDDALADEVAAWMPWAECVVVKRGVSRAAADSLHPERARELIHDAARRTIDRLRSTVDENPPRPFRLDPPIVVEIDFAHAGLADFAATIPGFERIGDRGIRYAARDGIEAYRAFVSAIRLAPTADS